MKGTNFLLEKVADDTPLSHFVALSNNLIKDEIYDREDKIRETEEKLGLNFHEARGLEDFGNYDEKQKFLSPIKEYITSQDGVTGYTVGLVQKQLDKLADSKKKALGKAAAREYCNFAETYVENRKNKSHEEAIKAAHNRLEAMSYDAGAKDGGEENITFKTSSSNFFKEPIKFLSYKLLNRDSKKKTLQSRSAMYIGYLKEDKIYKASEGGN
jgi:uncharacterized short protein YbdD (DUF466 family)